MEVLDFQKDMPGELVRDLSGHWTFVPRPLPASLRWELPLVRALSDAERALGRLVGIAQTLRDPSRLLVRSFLRREAELSSRIEGTHATFADVAIFEQTQSIERRTPDVRE